MAMKRTKQKKSFCSNVLRPGICLFILVATLIASTEQAIVPPPWSDPEKNPCATMPGGWQLLFWPPLQKCFKIFSIGYPCPETMELSPTAVNGKRKTMRNMSVAECRCPPGTALSAETNRCHSIFTRGPCEFGQYFSPTPDGITVGRKLQNRLGNCKTPQKCPNNMIFWPKDGKCYSKFTKGPCVKGKLLILNNEGLAECSCDNTGLLREYFYGAEETCHEHYTKGPCSTPGHLFLPGGRCDCNPSLPHYHEEHQMCFELNSPGPCPPGNIFIIPDSITAQVLAPRAQCQCKDGYIPWENGHCYRLYTRGPCGPNEFLNNSTTCIRNFCGKNRLYFPDQNSCYRIGSQGPCDLHKVVVFDFTARPSIDGISYNGMCGCAGVITNLDQQCTDANDDNKTNTCESTRGMVELNGNCYKLYTRGPCGPGQWLEPIKDSPSSSSSKAKCACRPGFTLAEGSNETNLNVHRCNAPIVGLARYLSNYQREIVERTANQNV